jgi:nucleoside-diphosphate-sugar epimerase
MKISILGCGWLGLPLAAHLLSRGYSVKGSTTTNEKLSVLKGKGIEPFLIDLSLDLTQQSIIEFLNSDLLIINIPPGTRRNKGDEHLSQLAALIPHIKKSSLSKIIFVSSTSVYADNNQIAKEEDLKTEADAENVTLFKAEEMIKATGLEHLILRCGGLTGHDRILVKYFAGKKDLPMGHCPVNLIHLDDLINIVTVFVEGQWWNDTYNICSPLHPLKKHFYTDLAHRMNMEPPVYDDKDASNYKTISSDKLIQDTKYSFLFPDPMLYSYT